jgi:DNA helicase INO80
MFAAHSAVTPFLLPTLPCLDVAEGLPNLRAISHSAWVQSCLSRPDLRWFVPPAVAPAIKVHCMDRSFLERQTQLLEGPTESLALYGLPPNLKESEEGPAIYRSRIPFVPLVGLVESSSLDQLPMSTMQVPEAKRLIYDSAKLARLDSLLQTLKSSGHRVLIYFQMTRMMDLMEEYLIFRQYKYLRLDGSSKLEDRRDMVMDWQTRSERIISDRFIMLTYPCHEGRSILSSYSAHVPAG